MHPQYEIRANVAGTYNILTNDRPVTKWTEDGFKSVIFTTPKQANKWISRKTKSDKKEITWRAIWRNAWDNMPVRISKHRDWQAREETTVPEFIKGQAKKKMKLVDGKVLEYRVTHIYRYGQQSTLARLLGYWARHRQTGRIVPGHNHIYNALCRGSRPKDDAKRELLVALSKPEGKALAIKMLTEMGIIHRYTL